MRTCDKIITLYNKGISVNDIANIVNKSPSNVYYYLSREGIQTDRRCKKVILTPQLLEKIKIDRVRGYSLDKLVDKYNVSKTSLYRKLNDLEMSEISLHMIHILHKEGWSPSRISMKLNLSVSKVNHELSLSDPLKKNGLTKEEVLKQRRRLNV